LTPRRHGEKAGIVVIKPESSSFLSLRSFWKSHPHGVVLHFRKPDLLILSGEKVKGRNKEKGGKRYVGRKGYVYNNIENAWLKIIP